ncbi:MAG: YitT family protein [Solobacterium sp.]|nr:YitT family protein [Solobacterium sp.]
MTDSTKKQLDLHFGKHDGYTILCVIIASLVYSFGMNRFVKPANLFPGGYGGIARLLSQTLLQYFHINLSFSIIYFALNIVTVCIVWKHIGPKFMIYSGLFFTLSSVFTALIPVEPITADILLVSVFGGVISGISMGVVLRNNASSGGTDFIAIWMSSKYNIPTWNYVMAGNAVILVLAGLLFGWDKALYSIIYQFVSTEIVNSMHQRYKYSRIEIVTSHPDEVCGAVFLACNHGITRMNAEGGFSHQERTCLILTVNTYQVNDVLRYIKAADARAFITISTVERVIGNYHQTPLE